MDCVQARRPPAVKFIPFHRTHALYHIPLTANTDIYHYARTANFTPHSISQNEREGSFGPPEGSL